MRFYFLIAAFGFLSHAATAQSFDSQRCFAECNDTASPYCMRIVGSAFPEIFNPLFAISEGVRRGTQGPIATLCEGRVVNLSQGYLTSHAHGTCELVVPKYPHNPKLKFEKQLFGEVRGPIVYFTDSAKAPVLQFRIGGEENAGKILELTSTNEGVLLTFSKSCFWIRLP